jgi:hypothetical protein
MAAKKLIFILLWCVVATGHAKELMFDVFMDEDLVGTHLYEIENNNVVSKANYRIKVLFMNFTYKHESFETYDDGCLTAIHSMTNDDGDNYKVSGNGSAQGMQITANGKEINLPGCISTFTYWDADVVNKKQLLNAQNAEWLDIEASRIGDAVISVQGKALKTQHHRLKASLKGYEKFIIELWYDENGNWVKLLSPTAAGDLIYKLH